MRKEGTSTIFHRLYCREGEFLPYRVSTFSYSRGVLQGLLQTCIFTLHSLLALPWEEAAQCTELEPGYHWAMTTRNRIAVLSCSLLGSPPSLILASVLGRLNSGSCLCVVTIPPPWSCLGFQLLVPGLAEQLHIWPGHKVEVGGLL